MWVFTWVKNSKTLLVLCKPGTDVTSDYEIITVLISKPNIRKLAIICLYKPPKGKKLKLTDFII